MLAAKEEVPVYRHLVFVCGWADDGQLFHAMLEGRPFQAQLFSCALFAGQDPVGSNQGFHDMRSLGIR